MTHEPDTTRIVRSWLEGGVDRLPDRVLDSTLQQLATTPQRRPRWPARRFQIMSIPARGGLVAAAAVAIVAIAMTLVPRLGPSGPGGPGPTPTASASGSTAPTTAVPSAAPLGVGNIGDELDEGSYQTAYAFPVPFTVTLPAGWKLAQMTVGGVAFQNTSNPSYLGVFVVEGVFADPCHTEERPAETPASVDEVTAALRNMEGFDATPVVDDLIGGTPAQYLRLSNSIDTDTADCTNGALIPLWTVPGDPLGAATNGGTTQGVWVLEVSGTIIAIAADSFEPGSSQLEDIVEIVDTMTFD